VVTPSTKNESVHNGAKPMHAKPWKANIKLIKNGNHWKQTKMEHKQNRNMWIEEAKAWNKNGKLNGTGNENVHCPNESQMKMKRKHQRNSVKQCLTVSQWSPKQWNKGAHSGGRRKCKLNVARWDKRGISRRLFTLNRGDIP